VAYIKEYVAAKYVCVKSKYCLQTNEGRSMMASGRYDKPKITKR